MLRTRPPYPPQFRWQSVEVVGTDQAIDARGAPRGRALVQDDLGLGETANGGKDRTLLVPERPAGWLSFVCALRKVDGERAPRVSGEDTLEYLGS